MLIEEEEGERPIPLFECSWLDALEQSAPLHCEKPIQYFFVYCDEGLWHHDGACTLTTFIFVGDCCVVLAVENLSAAIHRNDQICEALAEYRARFTALAHATAVVVLADARTTLAATLDELNFGDYILIVWPCYRSHTPDSFLYPVVAYMRTNTVRFSDEFGAPHRRHLQGLSPSKRQLIDSLRGVTYRIQSRDEDDADVDVDDDTVDGHQIFTLSADDGLCSFFMALCTVCNSHDHFWLLAYDKEEQAEAERLARLGGWLPPEERALIKCGNIADTGTAEPVVQANMTTTHTAQIIDDDVEYYVAGEDTEPVLTLDERENTGYLTFFGTHHKQHDEDGYSPPKYMVLDGVLDDLTHDALEQLGRAKDLRMQELSRTDDFEMTSCYVLPELRDQIRRSELRLYKRTRYVVTIERITRVDSGASSESESNSIDEKEEEDDKEKEAQLPDKKRKRVNQ